MHRSAHVLALIPWLAVVSTSACSRPTPRPTTVAAAPTTARALWNGKDLTGWETFLGIPGPTVQGVSVPRDASGAYTQSVGLNVDPTNVFGIATVDGAPAIRISGQIWGALTTKDELQDFHLSVEYKWGEKRWPPRQDHARDSGILYLAVGEHGVANSEKAWMQSFECQIQEGDTGDYWGVAKVHADFAAEPFVDSENRQVLRYLPGGQIYTRWQPGSLSRVVKQAMHEQPGWNKVEVVSVRGEIVHAVNGHVVLRARNPRRTETDGREVPITRGKVQLQSEGAEVFYRNITVQEGLTEVPAAFRL